MQLISLNLQDSQRAAMDDVLVQRETVEWRKKILLEKYMGRKEVELE